jgi:hypothetical protein
MPSEDPKSKRRYPRVETPLGVWAAWQSGSKKGVSRVRDLNIGGLFLADPNTVTTGSAITVLLSVAEGEIRCDAVVRNVKPGTGMGLEFLKLTAQDSARLQTLVARLLQSGPTATA